MSKREIDAVAKVLADPENSKRTAEEVAERAIAQLDELRSRTARLAVVGQIQFQAPGPTHTVVLGPFSCRKVLDSQSKFERAVEGGTAAREAGWGLAWDAKTETRPGPFHAGPAIPQT